MGGGEACEHQSSPEATADSEGAVEEVGRHVSACEAVARLRILVEDDALVGDMDRLRREVE
ncbi:MAG: hypothetical protein E2598_10450 [Sphingobium sp.]|nr:hypothetical protein [Sphingobium sp.]